MINYTLDEIRKLAVIYQKEEDTTTIEGVTPYDYIGLMENEIKDEITPEATLMDFIGAYGGVVHDESSRKILIEFLFVIPVDDMPMYMSNSDPWRSKVAHWRMELGK